MEKIQLIFFMKIVSLSLVLAGDQSCTKFYLRYEICKISGILVSVKDLYPKRLYHIPKLILEDNGILGIAEGAFQNLPNKEMSISFANKELDLKPKSFSGLTNLENLEIVSGIIPLNVKIFETLQSLKHLSLKINGSKQIPGSSLSGIRSLETLVISNGDLGRIGVDTFSNINFNIASLELNNDNINIIESGSFASLKGLKTLVLHENKLSKLTTEMFEGITELEHLRISGEIALQNIPKNIFKQFGKLKDLELTHDGIKVIETETFSDLKLERLDLSYNPNLKAETGAFRGLNVGVLGIICSDNVDFAGNVFADAEIKTLELSPQEIVVNRPVWGLSKSTNVLTGNCTEFS